jgi:RNA exonuclease 4
MESAKGSKKRRRRPRRRKSIDDSASSTSTSDFSDSGSNTSQHSKSLPNRRRHGSHPQHSPLNRSNSNKSDVDLPSESQCVALDCEMVGVGDDGHRSVVARVTIIDWHGQTLMDEYVRPPEDVTDYRTFVSGVTRQDLESKATMDVDTLRPLVLNLLQGKILIGHALKNDLKSLGVAHSWFLTRDTAKYDPFMQVRFEDGVLWPRKLKELCAEFLDQDIQASGKPHSPHEDALAALELYKFAQQKWERVMIYKINKTKEILGKQVVVAQ